MQLGVGGLGRPDCPRSPRVGGSVGWRVGGLAGWRVGGLAGWWGGGAVGWWGTSLSVPERRWTSVTFEDAPKAALRCSSRTLEDE